MSNIEADDDPVVATFDVYSAASLNGYLHLFQFPLRTSKRPYECSGMRMFVTEGNLDESGHLTSASTPATGAPRSPFSTAASVTSSSGSTSSASNAVIHPHSRITLHCDLDTFRHTSNFPPQSMGTHSQRPMQSRSSLVKSEGESEGPDNSWVEGGGNRHRFILHSEPFVSRSDYAVGVFKDGGLHLTSVSTIQQFTPALSRGEGAGRSSSSMNISSSSGSGGTRVPLAGAVTVEDEHCSKKPEDAAMIAGPIADILTRQLRRQRSYVLNTDAKTQEAVEYFSRGSVESGVIAKRLLSSTVSASVPMVTVKSRAIRPIDALFPPAELVDHGSSPNKGVLLRFASDFSVAAQVQDMLQSCQVISMESLQTLIQPAKHTVPPAASATGGSTPLTVPVPQLLEALRQGAMYIHGVWVAKSNERVFRGSSAALREVILMKFWQSDHGSIRREDINQLFSKARRHASALMAMIKDILQSVSRVDLSAPPEERRWTLKELPDGGAPAEVSKAVSAFQTAFPQEYGFQMSAWSKRVPHILNHIAAIEGGKVIRNLYLVAPSTATAGGTSTATASTAAAAAAAANQTTRPVAGASQDNSSLTSSAAASALPPPTDPVVLKVREFARRLFLEHGVINKRRAKELVARARDEQFPTATNNMLSVAMQEEVQQFNAATWILKATNDPEVDMFRPHVIAAALQQESFEGKAVAERALEILNHEAESRQGPNFKAVAQIPQGVLNRILSEIAVFKLGERLWHIKSGNV